MDDHRAVRSLDDPDLQEPTGRARANCHEESVVEIVDPHRVTHIE